jgi:uncharacterized OsmC-like protein
MGHVSAMQDNPELAHFEFRAHSEWIDGARTRTEIQDFYGAGKEDESRDEPFVLVGDEPPLLLGRNAGPNALETVLHGLASCLAVGIAYNAAVRGIRIEALEFDLEGELDLRAFLGISEAVRPGFRDIRINYRVKTDAPREEVEELCEYVQKTSPVLDILTNPVPVEVTLER